MADEDRLSRIERALELLAARVGQPAGGEGAMIQVLLAVQQQQAELVRTLVERLTEPPPVAELSLEDIVPLIMQFRAGMTPAAAAAAYRQASSAGDETEGA